MINKIVHNTLFGAIAGCLTRKSKLNNIKQHIIAAASQELKSNQQIIVKASHITITV